MTESDDRTVSYGIGFKRPPKHTQFQKGVSGNPYGRKVERHFVESTFHKILFSVVAPSRERRGRPAPISKPWCAPWSPRPSRAMWRHSGRSWNGPVNSASAWRVSSKRGSSRSSSRIT